MRVFLIGLMGVLLSTPTMAQDRLSLKSKNLSINADLRLRYENSERDISGSDDSRNRIRTRFRLNTSFATDYGWTVHAGLVTGDSNGAYPNNTWNESSSWDTGDIRLDYAYAEHTFDTGTRVLIGQQMNPYFGAEMLWAGDLRPTGFTLNQAFGPGFVTGGYYNMSQGGSAMGDIYAIQFGIAEKGDISYTAALGYYAANDEFAQDEFGDTTKYGFEVIQFYGDVAFQLSDGIGLKAFLEAGQNRGAEDLDTQLAGAPVGYKSEDNNTFYNVGVHAKVAKVGATVQYFNVEGDSVFGGLSNADLEDPGIGATDVEGYMLGLSYAITESASLGISYWALESIERKNQDGDMFRIEMKYEF